MPDKVAILVVDDDWPSREMLTEVLTREGYQVEQAASGEEAIQKGQAGLFDVIFTDIRMPGLGGLEALQAFREMSPETAVVLMTAFGSIETAVEAMKRGAFDYISKPINIEEIKLTAARALEHRRLLQENRELRREAQERSKLPTIIGGSRQMLEVYKVVGRVAPGRSTVLIQGESGTGKEVIARAIHYNSPRAAKPFVQITCSAIPESLIESELFGHMKGAFTGATAAKRGLLEEAAAGTCFLDEISDTSLAIQAKLLRVVQEHEIRRVGGTETIPVDIRIIAATNRSLPDLVKAGQFREDLFYRLSVVTVNLPPLRDRMEDIPLLAEYFLAIYAAENERTVAAIAPETMELLTRYSWPGNVRELEHVIERAVAMTANPVLLPEDLPAQVRDASGRSEPVAVSGMPSLAHVQRDYVLSVLKAVGGDKDEAARILGISRRTMYRLADRYGVEKKRPTTMPM